ncbi:hypothetical protein HYH03_015336 [Edaphochlamys debaryana]|uniref:Uncharacterized protein n=1 Tax=Edaphochlamys debaryana TaxID=47281 RepID=A0A835XNH6_9CHLO|nr:hypothetical protein HYH03_015336 [Edaphochlamys debaryana]|eukprot:KAG2486023.1 hypothetical protein HYH03_015336 [Edaphochlamys debaryana]
MEEQEDTHQPEDLEGCEKLIEGSSLKNNFLRIGQALVTINDRKLYKRAGSTSFTQYIEQRSDFGFGPRQALRLLAATRLVRNFPPTIALPTSERQVRALVGLDQQQAVKVWVKANLIAQETGVPLTHRLVESVLGKELPTSYRQATRDWQDYTPPDSDYYSTPTHILAAVRKVFGGPIDLDPASDPHANEAVKAARIYTAEEDGLCPNNPWSGKVFIHPPSGVIGSEPLQGLFLERAVREVEAKRVSECILFLRAAVGHRWFHRVFSHPHCWVAERATKKAPGSAGGGGASTPAAAPAKDKDKEKGKGKDKDKEKDKEKEKEKEKVKDEKEKDKDGEMDKDADKSGGGGGGGSGGDAGGGEAGAGGAEEGVTYEKLPPEGTATASPGGAKNGGGGGASAGASASAGAKCLSPRGMVVVYLGRRVKEFCTHFKELGHIPGHNGWSGKDVPGGRNKPEPPAEAQPQPEPAPAPAAAAAAAGATAAGAGSAAAGTGAGAEAAAGASGSAPAAGGGVQGPGSEGQGAGAQGLAEPKPEPGQGQAPPESTSIPVAMDSVPEAGVEAAASGGGAGDGAGAGVEAAAAAGQGAAEGASDKPQTAGPVGMEIEVSAVAVAEVEAGPAAVGPGIVEVGLGAGADAGVAAGAEGQVQVPMEAEAGLGPVAQAAEGAGAGIDGMVIEAVIGIEGGAGAPTDPSG